MITALLIVAGWALFLVVTVGFFIGSSHGHAPKPPVRPEEAVWLKAVAKVTQKRSA